MSWVETLDRLEVEGAEDRSIGEVFACDREDRRRCAAADGDEEGGSSSVC